MKTITIKIEDGEKQGDVEKLFVHGISQIMEDLQAIDADSLRLVTIDSDYLPPPEEEKPHGIVIEPDGTLLEMVLSNPGDDGELVHHAVGGYFQLIPNGHGMTVYANEDGNRLGLTPNLNATLLFERSLVGPIVCFGPPDAEGNVTALSDEQRAMIERL